MMPLERMHNPYCNTELAHIKHNHYYSIMKNKDKKKLPSYSLKL